MKIYKIAVSFNKNSFMEFCKKHNIDIDELNYMGSGDFGSAYEYNDQVIKITSDKQEFEIAKNLVGKQSACMAEIFYVDMVGGNYFIVMEKLEQPSEIEDLFYQLLLYCEENETDIEEVDVDEIEDPQLKKFADELQCIFYSQRNLVGIMRPDISPENLGYNSKNELKSFDATDTSGAY